MALGPYLTSKIAELEREAEQFEKNAMMHEKEAGECRVNAEISRKMVEFLRKFHALAAVT